VDLFYAPVFHPCPASLLMLIAIRVKIVKPVMLRVLPKHLAGASKPPDFAGDSKNEKGRHIS
jgi:hypothetical protein